MTARDRTPGEAGFTLMEVMIGLFIFSVVSLAALNVIVRTLQTVRDNNARNVAANLVTRQLESVRTQHATQIPDGLQTYTRTVGGIPFSVKQTATYVSSNGPVSVCTTGSGQLSSKRVTVTVSWPGMGTVKAPKADTLVSIDLASDNLNQPTLGTLALAVDDAGGTPLPNVRVTLTPGNVIQTTGEDGCIVFANLAAGGYSATVDQTGYVGTGSAQATTVNSLGVIAGGVTKGTLYYGTASSVAVTSSVAATATPPATLPLHFGASLMVDRTLAVCGTTPTSACISAQPFGTANELYPDVYTIWAGQCLDPTASSQVSADLRTTTPGAAVVPMGSASVTVNWHGSPEPNAMVTVTRQSLNATTPAPCAGTETYSVSVGATGTTLLALPYGKWLVTAPGGGQTPISLTSATPTGTVSLTDSSH